MTVQEELVKIIKSGEAHSFDELKPMWDQLEPLSWKSMIGNWRGGTFNGPEAVDPIRWHGKYIASREHVEPMLCRKEDSTIYAWDGFGQAQMRDVEYGGKVSACMIYDKFPSFDYFRTVTDEILLGITEIKGNPLDMFTYLVPFIGKDAVLPMKYSSGSFGNSATAENRECPND